MAEARPPRVLSNATQVIDALAENGPLTPAELAELIGVPRSTAYRLVEGLTAVDLVRPERAGRVALSLRWLRLADVVRDVVVSHETHAMLVNLAERTGQTVFLTVPGRDQAICVDWAQGRAIEILTMKPGRSFPLHIGAPGRVVLASLSASEVSAYLTNAPFERITPQTLSSEDELRADIALTRSQGHAISLDDVTVGIGAIGMPMLDADGHFVACLSLAGTSDELTARRDELLYELARAAGLAS